MVKSCGIGIIAVLKRMLYNLRAKQSVFQNLSFTNCYYFKKSAFTLADVLITLGIIGIIAAVTIPTLILKYKKYVTVNKVKNFYTVMSQATNSAISDYGSMDNWQGFTTYHNEVELKSWFDMYLKPYLKVTEELIKSGEFYVVLADGSVLFMQNYASSTSNQGDNHNGLVHVTYLTDKKLIDNKDSRVACVNMFTFLFYSPVKDDYFFQPYTYQVKTLDSYNRAYFMRQIKVLGNKNYCAALMMIDGWQIKSDYPYQTKK